VLRNPPTYRYFLVLPDGEVAGPGVLVTAVPNWEPGEVFSTGDGARWRLLATETDEDEFEFVVHGIGAIWTVEPVD